MISESPAVTSSSAASELPGAGTPAASGAENLQSLNSSEFSSHQDPVEDDAQMQALQAQIEASWPTGGHAPEQKPFRPLVYASESAR